MFLCLEKGVGQWRWLPDKSLGDEGAIAKSERGAARAGLH